MPFRIRGMFQGCFSRVFNTSAWRVCQFWDVAEEESRPGNISFASIWYIQFPIECQFLCDNLWIMIERVSIVVVVVAEHLSSCECAVIDLLHSINWTHVWFWFERRKWICSRATSQHRRGKGQQWNNSWKVCQAKYTLGVICDCDLRLRWKAISVIAFRRTISSTWGKTWK